MSCNFAAIKHKLLALKFPLFITHRFEPTGCGDAGYYIFWFNVKYNLRLAGLHQALGIWMQSHRMSGMVLQLLMDIDSRHDVSRPDESK